MELRPGLDQWEAFVGGARRRKEGRESAGRRAGHRTDREELSRTVFLSGAGLVDDSRQYC